jgi:oxygen-independent coproporphyrinogen-3 oxidase
MRVLSLYIHVPFCTRRCSYCSFFHVPRNAELEGNYTDALESELAEFARVLGELRFRTVFIGGGTPSVLSRSAMGRVFDAVSRYTEPGVTTEVTCELNPEDVDDDLLAFLSDRGVDRVSVGVQSMDPRAQRILKRCDPKANARAIERVTRRFSNVSFDVLLGIPGASPRRVTATLESLVAFGPTHFSVYCLEPGGDMAHEVESFLEAVDAEQSADEYLYTCDFLRGRGYGHYEVSNFALPGYESVHNHVYWEGGDYLGVGPGAHSFVDGRRFHNAPSMSDYLSKRGRERAPARVYDAGGAGGDLERVMLALRTARGMPRAMARCEDQTLSELSAGGLVDASDGRIALTDRGFLVMNDVILEIMGRSTC